MTFSFKEDKGNLKAISDIKNIDRRMKKAIDVGQQFAGRSLVQRAEDDILRTDNKTGREYFIKDKNTGRTRRHRASARGETHANLTGDTRSSLSFQKHGVSGLDFGYGVSTPTREKVTDYAKFLEGPTLERVSLQNAIKNETGNINQHFKRAIEEALK